MIEPQRHRVHREETKPNRAPLPDPLSPSSSFCLLCALSVSVVSNPLHHPDHPCFIRVHPWLKIPSASKAKTAFDQKAPHLPLFRRFASRRLRNRCAPAFTGSHLSPLSQA